MLLTIAQIFSFFRDMEQLKKSHEFIALKAKCRELKVNMLTVLCPRGEETNPPENFLCIGSMDREYALAILEMETKGDVSDKPQDPVVNLPPLPWPILELFQSKKQYSLCTYADALLKLHIQNGPIGSSPCPVWFATIPETVFIEYSYLSKKLKSCGFSEGIKLDSIVKWSSLAGLENVQRPHGVDTGNFSFNGLLKVLVLVSKYPHFAKLF